MLTYLRAFHIVANLVWIGAILAIAALLAKGPGDAKQRGESGRLVFRLLANPASALSLLLGLAMLGVSPEYYFKATHFMHAKLPLALAAFGLTHALGARARRMSTGEVDVAGPSATLGIALGVLALGSALLASLKPF